MQPQQQQQQQQHNQQQQQSQQAVPYNQVHLAYEVKKLM
jgi:hypothetical protein